MLPDISEKIDRLSATLKNADDAAGRSEHQKSWGRICTEIRKSWASALFSGADEHTIRRYFNFQATAIAGLFRKLGDGQCIYGAGEVLISLNEHLYEFFGRYLDPHLSVPHIYLRRELNTRKADFDQVVMLMASGWADSKPADCVIAYLKGWFEKPALVKGTLQDLHYLCNFLEHMLAFLNSSKCSNEELIAELMSLNFNHLLFFAVLRTQLSIGYATGDHQEKMKYLEAIFTTIPAEPFSGTFACDPQLPHIRMMLKGWIREELTLLQKATEKEPEQPSPDKLKIRMDISVPQLACLIRACFKNGIYGGTSLTDIFETTALHYRTARQESISAGSISKEYYGVTQQTAEKVIGMLQKMISYLKLTYFPVLVVTGIIGLLR